MNKAGHRRIDAFELWCWRRLLRVPWTARRSNQSVLKEISLGYSLEGLFNMLSMLVIAFLPRSKCLVISWLQSPPIIFKFFAINIFYFHNQNSSRIFYNITIKVIGIEDINESALTGHDFIRFVCFFLNLFFCILNYF